MSKDLLKKVIADASKDPARSDAYLSATQEVKLISNTDIEPGTVMIYKEFRPTRDSWEYTIYYRVDGTKYRVDLELENEDLANLGDGQRLEDNVALIAKTVIRSHLMRDRREKSLVNG